MSSVEDGAPVGAARRARRVVRSIDAGHFADVVAHLAHRQVASMHRFTLLGWAWPVVRQLATLAVFVFVFSTILDLGIDNFPVFVFSGLIAWGWFGSGVQQATGSLIAQRHLVFQPRFPVGVLPIVAVAVPFIDVLLVLPVLLIMLIVAGTLSWTVLLLLPLLAVQFMLMAGIGWITSAANVFMRDIENIVGVLLTLVFYCTPIFYSLTSVPERYRTLLRLNPMTTLVESYRGVLMGTDFPSPERLAAVTLGSAALALAGWLVFRRAEPRFVDEL
jgi:ABC-type polysaccharide/polyol phosphate export permease